LFDYKLFKMSIFLEVWIHFNTGGYPHFQIFEKFHLFLIDNIVLILLQKFNLKLDTKMMDIV
jgi:hypothetical protein